MKALVDLFFPPRCVGCERRGSWLCASCRAALPAIPPPRCRFCAAPTGGVSVCSVCWRDPPAFASIVAEFRFDGVVREAIHQLKYRRAQHLARPLVTAVLDVAPVMPSIDVVVPIPLHSARLRSRGFNQAGLLAKEVAKRLDRPVVETALMRVKETDSQTSLPAAQRWANVRDAFQVTAGESLAGQRVLLVDDVTTTTSTLRAASRALKRGGVSEVHAFVVARAIAALPGDRNVVSGSES